MKNPFRRFNSLPEVIRLAVMMYIRYPLSLRLVEDPLYERGIDICHGTVRLWWSRFDPMFSAEIRKRRVDHRSYSCWRWHLDEVFVRINGERPGGLRSKLRSHRARQRRVGSVQVTILLYERLQGQTLRLYSETTMPLAISRRDSAYWKLPCSQRCLAISRR